MSTKPRTRVKAPTVTAAPTAPVFKHESTRIVAEWLDATREGVPADLAATLTASVHILPAQGDVLKLSYRVEGSRWVHQVMPLASMQASTLRIVTALLVESARVTQYDSQLTKLGEKVAKYAPSAPEHVAALEKRTEVKALFRASRAKCKTLRGELGLPTDRYADADID